MATAVLARSDTERLGKGRLFDNLFFSGMVLVICPTAFVGFLCLPRPLQSLRTQTSYSDCNHRPYGSTHWSAALRCDNRQTPPGQHFLLAFPAAVGGL